MRRGVSAPELESIRMAGKNLLLRRDPLLCDFCSAVLQRTEKPLSFNHYNFSARSATIRAQFPVTNEAFESAISS
jgi:hypothetical protein